MSADNQKPPDKTSEEEPFNSEGTLETAVTKKSMISCKICNKTIQRSKIIMHLNTSKKGCKEGYGNFEALLAQRDKERKEYLKNYKKKNNELNADKIKKIKASKYSENSESINQKRREAYKLKTIAKRKDSDSKAETERTEPDESLTGIKRKLNDTDINIQHRTGVVTFIIISLSLIR